MTRIRRAMMVGLVPCLVCACPVDPELVFDPGASVLFVGQKARIVVTEGSGGSDLDYSSFELVDSNKKVFSSKSPALGLKRLAADELQFTVPPGIAAGDANISVETSKGPAFSGKVTINRLIAMRDLSGKLWLLALLGDGTASQFAEFTAGKFGFGHGQVAIGMGGRLLASTADGSHQLYLAWVGAALEPSPPYTFDPTEDIADLKVTSQGLTLVATSNGVYLVNPPSKQPPQIPAVSLTPLPTGDARGLAVNHDGTRAVAITDPGAAGYVSLSVIDLQLSPPAIIETLTTSWAGGVSLALHVGMSPDGNRVLAVDGTGDRVALFVKDTHPPLESDCPAGEDGAAAVVSDVTGDTFYVANRTGKTLSRIQVSDDKLSFATPLTPGTSSPVDLSVSELNEVTILLEHDMVLLYDNGSQASPLTFDNLFKDKVNGEVGGSVAVQP